MKAKVKMKMKRGRKIDTLYCTGTVASSLCTTSSLLVYADECNECNKSKMLYPCFHCSSMIGRVILVVEYT